MQGAFNEQRASDGFCGGFGPSEHGVFTTLWIAPVQQSLVVLVEKQLPSYLF
jgi:hypothetical protein